MQRKRKIVLLILILTFFSVITTEAREATVSFKLGTMGLGIEGTTPFHKKLNGRMGLNFMSINRSDLTKNSDPIDYDINMRMLSLSALMDWHPMENSFRLTGGFVFNGSRFNGEGRMANYYAIGEEVYTPEEIGDLKIEVVPKWKISPYVGLGWAKGLMKSYVYKFSFSMDVGFIYQGSPDVNIIAEKLAKPTEAQEKDIESDLDFLKIYPIVSFGINYYFNF